MSESGGVISYITNSNWIDGVSMAGFRKCLMNEFTNIYIINLKGGVRGLTKAEVAKQGKNVFSIMTGVCITILVKNPNHFGHAKIEYHDIGDYLSKEDKLDKLNEYKSALNQKIIYQEIIPNQEGDWLSKRSSVFEHFSQWAKKVI